MIVTPLILLAGLVVLGGFFAGWTYALLHAALRFLSRQEHVVEVGGAVLIRLSPSGPEGSQWSIQVLENTVLQMGQSLVAWEPRRQVPWGLIDLIGIVVLAFAMVLGTGLVLRQIAGPRPVKKDLVRNEAVKDGQPAAPRQNLLNENKLLIAGDNVFKLILMLIATTLIMLRTGTRWKDLGLSWRHVPQDIGLGIATFCMFAPIVFAVHLALIYFLKIKYEHPLIEMMTQTPDLGLFVLLAFSAVIIAPLSEEWAFRVLLQGWLEKSTTYTGPTQDLILGGNITPGQTDEVPMVGGAAQNVQPDMEFPEPDAQRFDNPYQSPQPVAENAAPPSPLALVGDGAVEYRWPYSIWKHWTPILVSSLIFALMHFQHGIAWIPLTVLSVGLGYIYQRTHRIVPSMTVHFCLNALSMALFWVQMFESKLPRP